MGIPRASVKWHRTNFITKGQLAPIMNFNKSPRLTISKIRERVDELNQFKGNFYQKLEFVN